MSKVIGYLQAKEIFNHAKRHQYAIPAINVVNSNTINACLETSKESNTPLIIQLSNGGAHFFAGKSLSNKDQHASIVGAVLAAKYIHELSDEYGVPVLINTDHASKMLLPWIDGMLLEGEKFYGKHGQPLFTSHMIDLSAQPISENVETCGRYLQRLSKLNMYLEIELGVTGGEEDGIDNTDVESSKLYTQPEDVAYAYSELRKISENFLIAASFGNVHGVYKPGNVKLEPVILKNSQRYIQEKYQTEFNPVNFVFHGGSGSGANEIREAIQYGVVKMNVDTDIQWAFWDGIHQYVHKYNPFLQSQLGNPEGANSPNKKFYDPRTWLREGELSVKRQLTNVLEAMNAVTQGSI